MLYSVGSEKTVRAFVGGGRGERVTCHCFQTVLSHATSLEGWAARKTMF